MVEMNKTHIVTTLSCGCEETRWLFGREITKLKMGCPRHGMFAPKRMARHWVYKREVPGGFRDVPSPQEAPREWHKKSLSVSGEGGEEG